MTARGRRALSRPRWRRSSGSTASRWRRGAGTTPKSLAEDGGIAYVGIERVHQIVRFDFARGGLAARGAPLALPPAAKKLPSNGSFEALEFVPKGLPLAGTLIAISERGYDENGDIQGFLIGGPSPGTFAVKRTDDFNISDCALVGSELFILERRYSIMRGVAMRIRRVPLAAIRPGAVLDGPAAIFADLGYEIDNMEGLSVHRGAKGDIVLTLISDDNFSPIQRTVLLQFALVEEYAYAAAAARFFSISRLSSRARWESSSSFAFIRKASSPPR